MELPLLSIIIPVYNTEEYLTDCLNSLVSQMKQRVEIILIDDSSVDKSWSICKKYEKKYDYIHVFQQRHSGLSAARNFGIQHAKGNYISFIDSDDFVSKQYLDRIFNILVKTQPDMLVFNYAYQYKKCTKASSEYKNWNTGMISKKSVIRTLTNSSYAWNKVYTRHLFKKVCYPVGQYYEDVNTTFKLVNLSQNIFYIDEVLYFYVQRTNSIVHMPSLKKTEDNLLANLALFKFLNENSYKDAARYQRSRLTILSFYYCLKYGTKNRIQFDKAKEMYINGEIPDNTPMSLRISINLCKKVPQAIYALIIITSIKRGIKHWKI